MSKPCETAELPRSTPLSAEHSEAQYARIRFHAEIATTVRTHARKGAAGKSLKEKDESVPTSDVRTPKAVKNSEIKPCKLLKGMAGTTGLEPATSDVTGARASTLFSVNYVALQRVAGVTRRHEPTRNDGFPQALLTQLPTHRS